jgi:hypothetical protein
MEALRDWLSIATGIATLLALALGILQLRNVQRSVELQADLATKQADRSIWGLTLGQARVAPEVLKERWGENAEETLFIALLIDHYETLYFQHRRGAIPRANWEGINKAMLEHMASPSIHRVWEKHKDLYWAPFVRHVERHVSAPG